MGYIQYGATIGLAAAAGVGTFFLGLIAVILVLTALLTLFAVVCGAGDDDD